MSTITVRQKYIKAGKTLDELYEQVQKFPDSPYRNGMLRYLGSCYRSLHRIKEVVGVK